MISRLNWWIRNETLSTLSLALSLWIRSDRRVPDGQSQLPHTKPLLLRGQDRLRKAGNRFAGQRLGIYAARHSPSGRTRRPRRRRRGLSGIHPAEQYRYGLVPDREVGARPGFWEARSAAVHVYCALAPGLSADA